MWSKKKWIWRLVRWLFVLLPSLVIFGAIKAGAYQWQHWFLYQTERNRVVPAEVFGLVTDQAGRPIEGAAVTLRITTLNRGFLLGDENTFRQYDVKIATGADGTFAVRKIEASCIEIVAIEKAGYAPAPGRVWVDSDQARQCLGFYFARGGGQYFPDPEHPAVYPLWRPGEVPTRLPSPGGK
jgi:hypothetical protein